MQQTKRRSKRGVILLAVVVAMLVMAIVPAVAQAAAIDSCVINNGATFTNSTTISVTYSSASATANLVDFDIRAREDAAAPWTLWYLDFGTPSHTYVNGSTATQTLTIPSKDAVFGLLGSSWQTGDQIQVRVNFYAGNFFTGYVGSVSSQVVTIIFAGPPVSTLDVFPLSHPGRGDIWWTNGDKNHQVWAQFGQLYAAPMGITHWIVTKNNDAAVVETPITWPSWGDPLPFPASFPIVNPPNDGLINPQLRYSNDGIYTVQHWAVSSVGQRQQNPDNSLTSFGYDTKHPYVVWTWPAPTSSGYYNTGTIAVSGDVIDDGGSGVAGYFADKGRDRTFAPEAHVYWRSAQTGGDWVLWEGYSSGNITSIPAQKALSVQIDAFDHYRWHVSGNIFVYPNYNADYAVFVTGSDYAGNGGFPYEDWGIPVAPAAAKTAAKAAGPAGTFIGIGIPGSSVTVDNMPPSTIFASDPASASVTANGIGVWTNKNVVLTFSASDAGGSGIGSGVDYTEYIVGNSGTYSTGYPPISAVGTKGTTYTVKDTAGSGPVYVWYRSVDKAGNKEAWNLVWVYYDGKAPVLSNDYNGMWYTTHTTLVNPTGISVVLRATDLNSHLATPGIEWQIPGWPIPFALPHWPVATVWTPLSQNPGIVNIPIDPAPSSATDGIWPLNSRATDMAGNAAVDTSSTVKIDTRPPATAGTAPFGSDMWVNGLKPYVLSATDQAPGSGVKVTWYRVDAATPWTASVNATPATVFATNVNLGAATQGAMHTVDFFSIDNAVTQDWVVDTSATKTPYPGNVEKGVLVGWTLIPGHPWNVASVTGYKSTTVKLDVTAPVVTAIDPKNGNWQKPLATVNFAGTDVGSGYNHTEWSTDGGTNWTTGSQAQVGGDGVITITYRGVDNVGIMSANQTIQVKVASTPPTVTSQNASTRAGKKWHNPTITFNITAVTPTATAVIQIRTISGRTLSTHHYANVATGADVSKTFIMNTPLKAGKYNIRVGAVDMAGNVQTKRGSSTLTVTK